MQESAPLLLTGATGLIGSRLRADLAGPVRALTRRSGGPADGAEWRNWDGRHFEPGALRGCAAVVHLAGEPVFGGLPTPARRRAIRASRVESTHSLVTALGQLAPGERPEVLACASAVGFYGSRGEERLDEESPAGRGFLAEVCVAWEAAAREAEALGVRVVSLRFGIVLAREGGALPVMARPFRLGLGGRLGDGRQWVPWVHVDDAVGLIRAALADPAYRGAVNVVAPEPVRNVELTRALGRVLHRPTLLPVPGFVLRGALGELADELLGSRRVVPGAAQARGFGFRHPALDAALETALR
jgi:uncharacterized protein (TIGR01777 family)